MKKNSGITILALIITIIILIILAIVSVSLVINSGILNKSEQGVNTYSKEEELEQLKLVIASAKLKGNGFLTTENLNSELKNKFGENKETIPKKDYWEFNGYNIYKDGKVEEFNSILPKEYQQVEYIESTGTQWIDTKIKPNINMRIKTHLYRTTRNKTWQFPFGARNTAGNNEFEMCFYKDGGGWRDDFGNTSDRIFFNYTTELGDFYIDKNKNACKVNDIIIHHSDSINFECNYNLTIFGVNYEGGIRTEETDMLKLYSFEIFNNNTAVRNFIPCYSTTIVTDVNGIERAKNTIGLYDTVNGQFYTNQGSGFFLKGNDV